MTPPDVTPPADVRDVSELVLVVDDVALHLDVLATLDLGLTEGALA